MPEKPLGSKNTKRLSITHCQAILKHEKANYNALVFVGVAAEGLDQEDQALMAYNKATQVDPEQQLAWQGLCSFYDKLGKEKHLSSLSEVYAKLLTFQQEDIAKYRFICEKLVKVYEQLQDWQKVVDLNLALLQKLADDDVPGRCDTWRDIIHSYGQLQDLNSPKVQQGDQYFIENLPEDKLEASWIEYIQWLLKKKTPSH